MAIQDDQTEKPQPPNNNNNKKKTQGIKAGSVHNLYIILFLIRNV